MGNMFPVNTSGTLTSIDLYGIQNPDATERTVTIDIFDENREYVGKSEPFLIPKDKWLNVPLQNISYSGTFYVMVHWYDTDGKTNWVGADENGPNAFAELDMLLYEGLWGSVHTELGGKPCVFMIRANVNENSKSVTYGPDKAAGKGLVSYAVYRLHEKAPESAWTELSGNVTELLYTDNEWNTLENGNYQYAVKAVYSGNIMSEAKLTNMLIKNETQIRENMLSNVKVYSHLNNIYIRNEANVEIKAVEITDLTGRILYQSHVNNKETVIPLKVSNGIYFVRLISQENASYTTRISIIH